VFTTIRPVRIRRGTAIYEMVRTNPRGQASFEVRFAVDGDGVWRIEAF
jgi:hypothetical protein